jgi:hypothetical protein
MIVLFQQVSCYLQSPERSRLHPCIKYQTVTWKKDTQSVKRWTPWSGALFDAGFSRSHVQRYKSSRQLVTPIVGWRAAMYIGLPINKTIKWFIGWELGRWIRLLLHRSLQSHPAFRHCTGTKKFNYNCRLYLSTHTVLAAIGRTASFSRELLRVVVCPRSAVCERNFSHKYCCLQCPIPWAPAGGARGALAPPGKSEKNLNSTFISGRFGYWEVRK